MVPHDGFLCRMQIVQLQRCFLTKFWFILLCNELNILELTKWCNRPFFPFTSSSMTISFHVIYGVSSWIRTTSLGLIASMLLPKVLWYSLQFFCFFSRVWNGWEGKLNCAVRQVANGGQGHLALAPWSHYAEVTLCNGHVTNGLESRILND